ncbi:uncharacterized protein LOC121634040 [Melanotaenia boesemani]|uniref:uncharacterized protein LOC121634040 n=1 Tax=Melanotaenia boesemani TaxID=1250792 RepID=UPI001C04AA35|nr:uncharacterized protein LOC121634040 [Melanotaenia boesemani]
MEKSQWDLKKIRFQQKRMTRLDDFVQTYKVMHSALLRDYQDSQKIKSKTHRVDVERWKQKKQRRRGVYVSPISKPFHFQKKDMKQSTIPDVHEQQPSPQHVPSQFDKEGPGFATMPSDQKKLPIDQEEELTSLWKRKNTEVVVAVLPSHIRGNNLVIHHTDLRTLRPHQWLTGEVIEGILHLSAHQYKTGDSIYILNHYTAGVILFGKRDQLRRHAMPKTKFDDYQAILSFVNTEGVHWKLLVSDCWETCIKILYFFYSFFV